MMVTMRVRWFTCAALAFGLVLAAPARVLAHRDGLDGPAPRR